MLWLVVLFSVLTCVEGIGFAQSATPLGSGLADDTGRSRTLGVGALAAPDARHGTTTLGPVSGYNRHYVFGYEQSLERAEKKPVDSGATAKQDIQSRRLYGVFPLVRLPSANYASGFGILATARNFSEERKGHEQKLDETKDASLAIQGFLEVGHWALGARYHYHRWEGRQPQMFRINTTPKPTDVPLEVLSRTSIETFQLAAAYETSEYLRFAIHYVPLIDKIYRPRYLDVNDGPSDRVLPKMRQRIITQPEIIAGSASLFIPYSPILATAGVEHQEIWGEPVGTKTGIALGLEVNTGFSIPRMGLTWSKFEDGAARRLGLGSDFVMRSLTLSVDSSISMTNRPKLLGIEDLSSWEVSVGLGGRI